MGRFYLFIFLAFSTETHAEQIAIDPHIHSEVVLDRLPTSTAIVVGAVFANGSRAETIPQFRATLPAETAGKQVCLRTTSVDGFYKSEYEYSIPENWSAPDQVTFTYPTEFPEIVSDLPGSGFAVAAALGTCASPGNDIYVGSWNTTHADISTELLVALNTSGADRVVVFVGDDLLAPAQRCTKIDIVQVTGFDFTCLLKLPKISVDRTLLEIQRSYGGTQEQPDMVWLRIAQ